MSLPSAKGDLEEPAAVLLKRRMVFAGKKPHLTELHAMEAQTGLVHMLASQNSHSGAGDAIKLSELAHCPRGTRSG